MIGGDHRHADAGDDARRADRAGADADLHRVDARIDQRLGAFGRRDVAGDEIDVREALPDARDHVEHALRVAVRRVDDEHVHAGRRRAPRRAPSCRLRDADRRAARAAGRARPCTRSDT